MHSIKEFTRDKLKKMEASGGPPVNVDRDADARADDYGFTEARSSNSAKFKHGGHAEHGKKPHMGRAGRATGGRAPTHDITKPTIEPIHMQDNVKLRARGGKASHPDEREDRELVHKMVKKEALSGEKKGGRVHRKDGGGMRSEGARDAEDEEKMSRMSGGEKEEMANERRGGRIHRARGGKAKGKTVVNVIVGAGHDQPPQAPAMMAPPPPPPPAPMPPPRPPMAPPGGGMMPPGGMPVGGAPMGAAGAPVGCPCVLRCQGACRCAPGAARSASRMSILELAERGPKPRSRKNSVAAAARGGLRKLAVKARITGIRDGRSLSLFWPEAQRADRCEDRNAHRDRYGRGNQ